MCTKEQVHFDLRIILNLDPLIIGIYLDVGIKQGYLINSHLLVSSKIQTLFTRLYRAKEGGPSHRYSALPH